MINNTCVNDPVFVNVVFQWWNIGVKYMLDNVHESTVHEFTARRDGRTCYSETMQLRYKFIAWSLSVLDISWLLFLKFACSWHFLALLLEVSVFLVYQKLLTRAVLTIKRSARRMQVAQSHLSQGFCLSVEACPSTVNKQHNLYQQITTTKKDNKSLMTCPCNLVLHGHDKSITWHDRCNRVLHGHDKPLTWHGPCIRLT